MSSSSDESIEAAAKSSVSASNWTVPERGSFLTPEEAHRLLTDTVQFNPQAIPSSGVPVRADTPLEVGQDLQIKWGSTWWAGTIVGFESDGRVRVHYFGWANSHDELKTRAELQLDRDARVRALDLSFKREGAPARSPVPETASTFSSEALESSPNDIAIAEAQVAFAPDRGSELTLEAANLLLTETVLFNPQSIPDSGQAVLPQTPLGVGQDLQIKWGGTWWAGSIVGFESDGRVRVHYFGWASSYDEVKDRSELQLDPSARLRALDQSYKRKGW